MKRAVAIPLLVLAFVLVLGLGGYALVREIFDVSAALPGYDGTWIRSAGVDLSNAEGHVDLASAQQDGLTFVIAKATEGGGYHDAAFLDLKQQASKLGLFFAAYHFGNDADTGTQVANFLSTAGDVELLFLDYDDPTSMSPQQAIDFLRMVDAQHGQICGIYIDVNRLSDFEGGVNHPDLANRPKWIAKYSTTPPDFAWDIWQYTDGSVLNGEGKKSFQGIGRCDVNHFNGPPTKLVSMFRPGEAVV